ncbi:MAG TPA: hypothetical protein VFW62_03850, partial [bacterium]|nr:hypothetical protein [bacterium]
MKTQRKHQLALGLLALNLIFAGQAMAELKSVDLDSADHLLVTIPAESAESTRLIYSIDDSKVEAFPKDGEVIELSAELKFEGGSWLGDFSFLGYTDVSANNVLEIIGTDPIGYGMNIKFKSTSEKAEISSAFPLTLEAPGAKVEVVFGGDVDEIENSPSDPITFFDEAREFHQDGVLDIRFVVEQAPIDDGANDDQSQPEASGGCSML